MATTSPVPMIPSTNTPKLSNASSRSNTSKPNVTNTSGPKQPAIARIAKRDYVSIIIQVAVGIIVSYLIYLVALHIMSVDKLVIDEKYDLAKKKTVMIMDGSIDASSKNIRFNTTMPVSNNYLPIRPSVNIKGGAQFTYSFWLFKDSGADCADKILFIKGDDRRYNFSIQDNLNTKVPIIEKMNEHMVFCPMVKFGADPSTFEVKFNTLDRYDEVMKIEKLQSSDSVYRNNLLSTLENAWCMITVSFEDNILISDFENGILCKFYVNDILYKVGRFASALKQNQGDMILFPNTTPISNVKLSNLTYYNYVLSEKEIQAKVQKGPSIVSSSASVTSLSKKPPVLSDYNKLDVYNM
jgi:hypothetical protein